PLTDFSSTDELGSWSNLASRWPLMVESSERPETLCASSLPLMQEACTSPVTRVISSEPLISLISSSRTVRGTVSVYSTLGGLLCEPQLNVRSWSRYLVRIERR